MSQHSLPDQIEADKYIQRKAAASRTTVPIRLAQIQPGGAY